MVGRLVDRVDEPAAAVRRSHLLLLDLLAAQTAAPTATIRRPVRRRFNSTPRITDRTTQLSTKTRRTLPLGEHLDVPDRPQRADERGIAPADAASAHHCRFWSTVQDA